MRIGRHLSVGAAGLVLASLTAVALPTAAAADECASGYTLDQTGQCVSAPQQGQEQPASGAGGPAVLPPNLSANTCGEGYEFDQAGSCVSTSAAPTEAPTSPTPNNSTEGNVDGFGNGFGPAPLRPEQCGPGNVGCGSGFGESACPGGCE